MKRKDIYKVILFLITSFLLIHPVSAQEEEKSSSDTEIQTDSKKSGTKKESASGERQRKPFSLNISASSGTTTLNDNQRFPANEESRYERALFTVGSFTPGMDEYSTYMLSNDKELSKPEVEAYVNHSRFYLEYRSYRAGVLLGFTSGNYSYREIKNPLHDYLLTGILLAHSGNPGLQSNILQYLKFYREQDQKNQDVTFGFNMIEAAYSFHFNPNGKWDPYINLGIKIGGCSYGCAAAGGFLEGGFRYNFKSFHVNTGIYQQAIAARNREKRAVYNDTTVLIGIGFHI